MGFRVIQPAQAEKPRFRVIAPAQPARKAAAGDDVHGALDTLYRSVPFADEAIDRLYSTVETGTDLMRGKTSVKAGDNPIDAAKASFGDFKRNYAERQGRRK